MVPFNVHPVHWSVFLCVFCQVCALQKTRVGMVNPKPILIMTPDMSDEHIQWNRTWLPPYSTENNAELDSKYHLKSRQRRNAPDLPLTLVGIEETDAPSQLVAYQKGDFILGGMFAVLIPDGESKPCSKILQLTGLRMESMMYAVDVINNSTEILPDVKLGVEIRNDCSDPNKALREAVSYITVSGGEFCTNDEPQTIGVVGTGSSATATGVANLLGLFKVPQVSYSASSSVLSDKKLYPYFLRTVPSDVNQAAVMADLAEVSGWNYVSIIFTTDTYGSLGTELLRELLQARNVCVAHMLSLNRNSDDREVVKIVTTLKSDTKSSVIFTFCLKHDILRVLQEAKEKGLTDRTWIASDSWGHSMQTVEGVESVVRGMLGISPKSSQDENFQRYLSNLDPLNNHRNPWYKLTLGDKFNCTFYPSETSKRKLCTGNETFADVDDTHARFVIDAVYALAYGLHNMITECQSTYCGNGSRTINPEVYLDYVKSVHFSGLTNPNFKFDGNGDPMAQYEIHNLQHHNDKYSFVKVTDWDPTDKFSQWQDVEWQTGTAPPVSRCSDDCSAGYYIALKTPKCCWDCHKCEAGSISATQNSLWCQVCTEGQRTNEKQTACLVNPIIFLEWDHAMAIVLVILTTTGLLATGVTLAIYIRHRNSATIKATSTELSYVLLVGIAMSYASTFLFIATPTDEICSAKIVMVGTSFSVFVGALLTKTNRISCIFNRKLSDGAPSMFLNIQYQLMFALGIVIIQIVLQVIWLQLEPVVVVKDTTNPEVTLLRCEYSSFFGPGIAVGFNVLLAVLCLYKAFRTRKLPGQFNDSRGICFAMLTCCLIWFIFFSCYFTTDGIANSIICSLAFIANGTSGLVCMFVPKLWIVIMRPELNVRQSTLKLKSSRLSSNNKTVNTVSNAVKKNGKVTSSLSLGDMRDTPCCDFNANGDDNSQMDIVEDDQLFLEEVAKMEEDLRVAIMERNDAVAMANKTLQEMLDVQKMEEEELQELDRNISREKTILRRLLDSGGMLDESLELSESSAEEIGTGDDSPTTIDRLISKLSDALRERDKLSKEAKDLQLECQHWRNVILQECSTSNGAMDNSDHAEDTLGLTDTSVTFV